MWQREYEKKGFYWGSKPEKGLKEVLKYTKRGIALDIGAGEGRNSIFLAKNEFEVEAIDKIEEGLEKCKKNAEKYNLPIKTKVSDIKKLRFRKNKYSLVLSIATLDFFRFSEIKKLFPRIKGSMKKGGILYFVCFSTKDPVFKKSRGKLKIIEKNTFYFPKFKTFRHFFEKKELLDLLKDFKILKIKEKKIKDVHGDEIHYHQIIKVIAKKEKGETNI